MPRFGKRTPLTREHFSEFEAAFASTPPSPQPLPPNGGGAGGEGKPYGQPEKTPENLTSRYRSFSREWIRERADSLDIAWLKDDNAEDAADLPEPAVLAQEAMGELEGALAELQAILAELGEVAE
jgi:type I restriction enzyme M protein